MKRKATILAVAIVLAIVNVTGDSLFLSSSVEAHENIDDVTCVAAGVQIGNVGDLAVIPQLPLVGSVDRVYMADTANHRLIIGDQDSVDCLWAIGTEGDQEGEFQDPGGVTLDGDGFIYVADTGNGRIQKFDPAFDEVPGDPINFIDVFDAVPTGSGPLGLSDPQGLGIDVTGGTDRILVADAGNSRVAVFGTAGTFISTFGEQGDDTGEMMTPADVAVCDTDGLYPGRLYVADQARDVVLLFDPLDEGGAFIREIGRSGSDFAEFSEPSSVALDHQCNLYVADTGNDRVQMFDADGGFVEAFATDMNETSAVIVDLQNPSGLGINVGSQLFGGDGQVRKFEWIDYDTIGDGLIDSDGDALLDLWETDGIDIDHDGEIDLDLPSLGADALHKDIFIEVDYMSQHDPRPEAITDVIDAFANAPVDNPDGNTGINVHIEIDEELPHQDDLDTWSDFDAIKSASFGSEAQRADANGVNIVAAKRLSHRYGLYAHVRDSGGSSGRAKSGGNFVVSLGASGWGLNDAGTHNIGSEKQQAGTFMHELGHTLSLGHGGGDGNNYKPNYLSVMSYWFQTSWITNPTFPQGRLNYSNQTLDPLDEDDLDENDGIGLEEVEFQDDWTAWYDLGFAGRAGPANGALNWDASGSANDSSVTVDINGDRLCVDVGQNNVLDSVPAGDDVQVGSQIHDGPDLICDSTAAGDDVQSNPVGEHQPQPLEGHNDWANLDYNFRNDTGFTSDAAPFEDEEPELTAQEAQIIQDFWEDIFTRKFQYSSKFVCMPEVGPNGSAVLPGRYRTVVNVHNPHNSTVTMLKKAVIARSEDEERGQISGYVQDVLEPDQALSVDCRDITGLFGTDQPLGDGFVVLKSDVDLDVYAVYTTNSAIDVEHILPTIVEEPLPDLSVALPEPLLVTCDNSGSCTHSVDVLVDNTGEEDVVEPFALEVHLDNGIHANVIIPSLPGGQSQLETVVLGPGENCLDPDCEVIATIDSENIIDESDETNNQAHRLDEAEQEIMYSAKFVCAPEVGATGTALRPGRYRTVINIHNPHDDTISIRKKAVIARSEDEERGQISDFIEDQLEPDQALSVDCRDILGLFGENQPLGDGFVVVISDVELDVFAVYTVAPRISGRINQDMDVERIPPRWITIFEDPDERQQPDLTVQEIDMDNLRVSCPGGQGTCVTQVEVTVLNQGDADAGPFNIEVVLDPSGSVVVDLPAAGLTSGDTISVPVITPPGGNCFDPDCTVCVTADSQDTVLESDETNNNACETRGG